MSEIKQQEQYFQEHLICNRCRVPAQKHKASFTYLEMNFHAEVLRCPECGQIFIPESLAKGRMAEVESEIEDK